MFHWHWQKIIRLNRKFILLEVKRDLTFGFEFKLKIRSKSSDLVDGRGVPDEIAGQPLLYVDEVTGVYNTRYLNYILEQEMTQALRLKQPFALLFIDADQFKEINDKYGHRVGTRILNELGGHLKRFVREQDFVFRYGGDEFMVVLSTCHLSRAKTVAERIRKSVEQAVFLSIEGLNIRFTVSIGVALYPLHAQTKESIIDVANHAMYRAKKTMKNRVFVASSPLIKSAHF